MQTSRQSRIEVGADFGVSLLVNLIAQFLVYGALATAGRSLGFAALILGMAIPRRYMTRRFFNSFVTPNKGQTPWQSWLEIIVDTIVAITVAIILQRFMYGDAATLLRASSLTIGLYLFTMVRRYVMRRLFEILNSRQNQAAPDLAPIRPKSKMHCQEMPLTRR